MNDLTVVVPFWNGHRTIGRLLDSLPADLPVIVVDDHSDTPLHLDKENVRVLRLDERRYFSGAVNAGVNACETDVLVLNQDTRMEGDAWQILIAENRKRYAIVGEGVMDHPAWPRGYVQGTFMFIRRDAWDKAGPLNQRDYPLWGSTCEWQLRACRLGFRALPLKSVPGLLHGDEKRPLMARMGRGVTKRVEFGASIAEALLREPHKSGLFIRTPPMVSVVIPCYNYARYLEDAVNSLVGGPTCLGEWEKPGQTFQSFEIIIVDDASTDETLQVGRALADAWKGIRYVRLDENQGTAGALNEGIKQAYGYFIQILSADDMLEADVLDAHYRTCAAHPQDFAFGNMWVFKDGKRVREFRLPAYDFEKVLVKNSVGGGIMYPTQAWKDAGGYPEIMRFGREDWAFNVALGITGCCGVHSGNSGYLYRREKQNRSLRTGNVHKGERLTYSARDWRQTFVRQMHALYPRVYAGERGGLMARCCGGRGGANPSRNRNNPKGGQKKMNQPLAGSQGMTMLEYIEGNDGSQTFTGPETGTRYIFGGTRPVGLVDTRDAPGLLAMRIHKQLLFKQLNNPQPPQVPEPAQQEANPILQAQAVMAESLSKTREELDVEEKVQAALKVVSPIVSEDKVPDPAALTVRKIKALDLTPVQAGQMLMLEITGKNRKGLIDYLEGLLTR